MVYFQNNRKIKRLIFGILAVISAVFINYIMENMEYIRGIFFAGTCSESLWGHI